MDKKYNEFNNLTEEERFDLLSAYIDEEVTPSERQQVQYLLDNDSEFKRLYAQLNSLSSGIKHLPIPLPETSARELSERVFQQIDRQSRLKRLYFLAGGAISAMLAGAVLSLLPGNPARNLAVNSLKKSDPIASETLSVTVSEPIAIAINEPVVRLPQANKDSEK